MNLKPFAISARLVIEMAGDTVIEMQKNAAVKSRRGKDVSTDADHASQDIIKKMLLSRHPKTPFYGEESDDGAKSVDLEKGIVWVVDPIDGTHNYRKGCGPFGISIALLEYGVPILGTVCFPSEKKLYQGCEGGRRGFELECVNQEQNLAEATVWTDWTKQSLELTISILKRLRRCSSYPTLPMCATYGLMMVATGKIEGYVHPYPAIEDHAAAGFLVQLAGGRVTDIKGNAWTPFSTSIVATNGKIHEALLNALSDVV